MTAWLPQADSRLQFVSAVTNLWPHRSVQQHVGTSLKAVVALLLTFAAGFVDIVGLLSLYHSFTAHMTGVTVHLGHDIAQWTWTDAGILMAVLLCFVTGSVSGRTIAEVGVRHKLRAPATAVLLIEFLLILAVAVATSPNNRLLMLLLLAAAMGIQTAALTRVGSLTIHTTFVTGMLNKLAQLISNALFLTYDELRGTSRRSHLRPIVHRQAVFIFSIWLLYLLGAVTGTLANSYWKVHSLFVPAGIVLAIIVLDQVRPLAIELERDQRER